EVTGGFAVDGHYWQTAVVVTATEFLGRNLRADLPRLFQHCIGKYMANMMLADDDLHVYAEIVFAAQDLDHATARALGGRWPLDDLDLDHHAFQILCVMKGLWSAGALARGDRTQPRAAALHRGRFRFRTQNTVSALLFPRALHASGNDDLRGDFLVDRRDEVVSAAVVEFADHRLLPALHDPHDSAFGASILPDGTQLHEYLVA